MVEMFSKPHISTLFLRLLKIDFIFLYKVYTVKSAHVVTSIKQSPVLKGHICLVLS